MFNIIRMAVARNGVNTPSRLHVFQACLLAVGNCTDKAAFLAGFQK